MIALIGTLSLLGLLVLLVLAGISVIKKTGKAKKYLLWSAACFIIMIIAIVITPPQDKQPLAGDMVADSAQPSPTNSTAPSPTATPAPSAAAAVAPSVTTDTPPQTQKPESQPSVSSPKPNLDYDVMLDFPEDRYPETASHIKLAIEHGESQVCTIDRNGADENRGESLKGIPTKKGYDRDEFPMAMCAEGGAGADVAYVESSDNRGSGSWVGNQLEGYADGTRVLFVIDGASGSVKQVKPNAPSTEAPKATPNKPSEAPIKNGNETFYANCTAVKDAGAAPLYIGDPGYSTKLDRDKDGVACER